MSDKARLLFVGLWMLADREGRLEDRPLRIKAELFAYHDVDIDSLLDELADLRDFAGNPATIERYQVDGRHYIQVVNFLKHQRPHSNEKASTIPPPDGPLPTMVESPSGHGGNHDEPSAQPLRPDSLIPDLLNEDLLTAEDGLSDFATVQAAKSAAPTTTPDNDVVELITETPEIITDLECHVVECMKAVPGMSDVTDAAIVEHFREIMAARDEQPSEQSVRFDTIKFRDHWRIKRESEPRNRPWPNWRNAMTNWFGRTTDMASAPSRNQNRQVATNWATKMKEQRTMIAEWMPPDDD